jgi:AAA+ ATPase superfamily predicted ATPase
VLEDYSVKDSVQTYGVIGGTPEYVRIWDSRFSFKENVCRLILSPSGGLYDAAQRVITSELREPQVYNTILYAMATGKEKLNDIYEATGYSRPKISVYLKNLAAFDVIEKVMSFDAGGWDHAKKGIYRIKNNFISFYYHFIYSNRSALFTMSSEEFYDTYIAPGLATYMQRAFVDVCREYLSLLNLMGKLPLHITKMGTWVGKEGTVDLVGENEIREYVAAICNWSMDAISVQDYENLQKNLKLARIRTKVVYLFSATSFTDELKALAEADASIVLVDMRSL